MFTICWIIKHSKNWLVYLYENTEALLEGVGVRFREHYLVAFWGSDSEKRIKTYWKRKGQKSWDVFVLQNY